MVFEVVVGLLTVGFLGILSYLSPAIKVWLEMKSKETEELRLDLVTFLMAGRQIYDDNEQLMAYVQKLVHTKYPKLNLEYVEAHILSALEWLEKGEVTIYTRGMK